MEVRDGAQITAAASLRRFDSTSSVGERRQLPLWGSLGRGGKQSFSCIRICVDSIEAHLFILYYIQN